MFTLLDGRMVYVGPCCDAHPHDAEADCAFNVISSGVRH